MADRNRGPFPRLFPKLSPVPASQLKVQDTSNGRLNTKASLLPRGAYAAYEFFSPDGGRTIIDLNGIGHLHLALVAYWYVATRWRAQKIAEAPLMVVEEDQEDGSEEWLPDHELAEVLEMPSLDYDMGELLERTSRYLDDTAEVIWVIDRDRINRTARLTPFKRGEFTVKASADRLYDIFTVKTRDGERHYTADQVCYFRDTVEGWTHGGRSRLDVAMSWLQLGEKARQTIRDLMDNSIWPSAVVIPDKDWNPDPETLEIYKQDLEAYALPGNKARPFVQIGGGTFQALTQSIKDLVPSDVLNRVESVVSAVTGVPAIVLQFQVGMENSPWSQMEQARKMAYDDTIQPTWRKLERVLTRQLLRPVDDDRTHYIRFDRSQIESLQENLQDLVMTATMMGRQASLNERRNIMGLEPSEDPKADEIPELSTPDPLSLLSGRGGADADEDDEEEEDEEEDTDDAETEKDPAKQARKKFLQRKARVGSIQESLMDESRVIMEAVTMRLLRDDADNIADIVNSFLTEATHKSIQSKERGKQRVISAVVGYLRDEASPRWAKATTPLLVRAAERSTAIVAADMGVNYSLLHPNVIKFSQKEAGELIQSVTKTTRQLVNDVVTAGLQEGRTTKEIAQVIQESTGFSRERAQLIARTETTRAFNGGPHESLKMLSRSTGQRFVKTWSTALDSNVRDEHASMEGQTVEIDQPFSNGLMYPSEPNCRCVVLHSEVNE